MALSHSIVGTSRFGTAVRLFCYAVLGVSTWCGPIPWMHCHPAAAATRTMEGHLALHHGRSDETHQGWHFHLLLLTELGTSPCGPDCPGQDHEPSVPLGLPLAYGVSVVSGHDGAQPIFSLATLDFAPLSEVVSLIHQDTSIEPLPGSTGSTPVVDRAALLCVARC